jgi:ATP-binding cassette, subfamily B (MDR/TAP), member 1
VWCLYLTISFHFTSFISPHRAGSVAYSTVSGIKTVLSLNAIPTMLSKYYEATEEAMINATAILWKQGFANGSMLGSFLSLYAILCLYGTYLLYKNVQDDGCDPSGGVLNNETCSSSGSDVFGAMLGVAFAAQGISQVGNALETFSTAKASVFEALKAIKREPGAEKEIIYHDPQEEDTSKSTRSFRSTDLETAEGRVKAILPKYEIDALSDKGLKPHRIEGRLTFDKVKFSYPTRPGQQILNDFSIEIEAGKTIAFVGPRYVNACQMCICAQEL